MLSNDGQDAREIQLRTLIETMTEAMSAGDTSRLVECWSVPALIIDGLEAVAVTTVRDVEVQCANAIEALRHRGDGSVVARIEKFEPLANGLVSVDVVWMTPGNDPSTNIKRRYFARSADGVGVLRICVSAALPATTPAADPLSKALIDSFPASDPISASTPSNGTAANK